MQGVPLRAGGERVFYWSRYISPLVIFSHRSDGFFAFVADIKEKKAFLRGRQLAFPFPGLFLSF